jgi:hypothetical protein
MYFEWVLYVCECSCMCEVNYYLYIKLFLGCISCSYARVQFENEEFFQTCVKCMTVFNRLTHIHVRNKLVISAYPYIYTFKGNRNICRPNEGFCLDHCFLQWNEYFKWPFMLKHIPLVVTLLDPWRSQFWQIRFCAKSGSFHRNLSFSKHAVFKKILKSNS